MILFKTDPVIYLKILFQQSLVPNPKKIMTIQDKLIFIHCDGQINIP